MKYTLRIKKNKVFKYIFKRGEYFKGQYVIVHTCKTKYSEDSDNNNMNFFGVCVSKKNGNSVDRNKLKRLARETYKREEESLKKCVNVVVVYRKDTLAKNIGFHDVYEDITNCFKELDLYE